MLPTAYRESTSASIKDQLFSLLWIVKKTCFVFHPSSVLSKHTTFQKSPVNEMYNLRILSYQIQSVLISTVWAFLPVLVVSSCLTHSWSSRCIAAAAVSDTHSRRTAGGEGSSSYLKCNSWASISCCSQTLYRRSSLRSKVISNCSLMPGDKRWLGYLSSSQCWYETINTVLAQHSGLWMIL